MANTFMHATREAAGLTASIAGEVTKAGGHYALGLVQEAGEHLSLPHTTPKREADQQTILRQVEGHLAFASIFEPGIEPAQFVKRVSDVAHTAAKTGIVEAGRAVEVRPLLPTSLISDPDLKAQRLYSTMRIQRILAEYDIIALPISNSLSVTETEEASVDPPAVRNAIATEIDVFRRQVNPNNGISMLFLTLRSYGPHVIAGQNPYNERRSPSDQFGILTLLDRVAVSPVHNSFVPVA
jgi:hypothetical protein